ncbi:GNAT family N-acetyltransferase [Streptomyces amakusaensis]|uniref:GNAT family N-acetyltransferase n=1 Tax=Streptomyces amakusaensis TaxID=67271 RepID=A0ABW0AEC2_9ACTN
MPQVREMTTADIDAVSALRVAGWQSAYAGIVPQPYLDAMTAEADALRRRERLALSRPRTTDLVAVADGDTDGVPVGWACLGPSRDEAARPDTAELYALYARPDLIGTGIGRALLTTAHSRARTQHFTSITLWVLAANHPARLFYERAGYRPDGATQDDVYTDTTLTELRYTSAL